MWFDMFNGDWITCPECGYEDEDGVMRFETFCPSYPDKCAGCEVHEDRRVCPDCGYEWRI